MHVVTKRQREMEGKPLEKTDEGLGEEIKNMHINLSVLKTPTGKTDEMLCLLLTINDCCSCSWTQELLKTAGGYQKPW